MKLKSSIYWVYFSIICFFFTQSILEIPVQKLKLSKINQIQIKNHYKISLLDIQKALLFSPERIYYFSTCHLEFASLLNLPYICIQQI